MGIMRGQRVFKEPDEERQRRCRSVKIHPQNWASENGPDCRERVVLAKQQLLQHDMSRAHTIPQDRTSRRRRYLTRDKHEIRSKNNGQPCPIMRMNTRTVVFYPSEDVVHVVRKESLCVEHRLYHPCNRTKGHVLCMGMTVPLLSRTDASSDGADDIVDPNVSTHLEALLDLFHEDRKSVV